MSDSEQLRVCYEGLVKQNPSNVEVTNRHKCLPLLIQVYIYKYVYILFMYIYIYI
jgi:hypothetical protein